MTQQALFEAISAGDEERVAGLVRGSSALARARHGSGISAVLFALYSGQPGIAERLGDASGPLDVHELAALGRVELLCDLLDREHGAVSAWSADGFQPVHLAAFFARQAALETLREART